MKTNVLAQMYRTPAILTAFPRLVAAESTRHGGVSLAPFVSLNLGINTDDSPENVAENRQLFFNAIGAANYLFASSYQVHGTEILHTIEPGRFDGYDALITNQPGLLVGVTVADCVPVLIYDVENQAVAAIHAGWRGTVGGIVSKTLAMMQQQFGTQSASCYAYVGTCIDACSFEVGPEVAREFDDTFVRVDPVTHRPGVDLKAANRQQLIDAGVPVSQIELSSFSTVLHNQHYFSHRAEKGQTGRMLVVIGLRV